MTIAALFVDLPNFYSNLLRTSIAEPTLLREYVLNWLDFDILSESIAGQASPVWIFYSGRRLGPSSCRIDDKYLEEYIRRLNKLRGVTARDVNIPGSQREPASYLCEECGHEGIAQWESEKGIDASLTVHLFDTSPSWDVAYLLSADADFVPVVASLRRSGKIINGAGFSQTSEALVRECFEYIDLMESYIFDDFLCFLFLRPQGFIHQWLSFDITSLDISDTSTLIGTKAGWTVTPIETFDEADSSSSTFFAPSRPYFHLSIGFEGHANFEPLLMLFKDIQGELGFNYQEDIDGFWKYQISLNPSIWKSFQRRLIQFEEPILQYCKEFELSRGRGYSSAKQI